MSAVLRLAEADAVRRTDGCTDACVLVRAMVPGRFGEGRLRLHSPEAHEAHGARTAGLEARRGVVETGALRVDLDRCEAAVDGIPVHLTGTQFRLLAALAARLDVPVPAAELVRAVWPMYGDPIRADAHLVRVVLSRLRAGLGPRAAGLVESRIGLGVRLRTFPLGAPAPPVPGGPVPSGRWAIRHDCCVVCGTTERAHAGLGACYLVACRTEARRRARAESTS